MQSKEVPMELPVPSERSRALFARALEVIASGVNSTARATFSGWEPYPIFVAHGEGSRVYDVDGNAYLDYLLGLGPMLFGHRPPEITQAVVEQITNRGTVFALPMAEEIEVAERMVELVPSVEQVHLTNTGTEAVLYALRIARAATGRPLVVRFEGMYHGFSDGIYWSKHPDLAEAGPDDAPCPVPQGPGLPPGLATSLLVLPWNDVAALERAFAEHGDRIAAVITEPIMANTGCILPEPGYLERLRELCSRNGAVLIFDEVITGFRVHRGGAQAVLGIQPDLTTFAKGLGGGFPVAAVGGRRELMALVADGTVSMAGTYAANGIAVAAARAALGLMAKEDLHTPLVQRSQRLQAGIGDALAAAGLAAFVVGSGPIFQVWFADRPIRSYRDAARYADAHAFRVWWEEMLVRGVLFHPGHLENLFVSFAHSDEDIDATIAIAHDAAAATARRLARR
jgi:glutamate-1-semialdehyde 2,1-aminomutase